MVPLHLPRELGDALGEPPDVLRALVRRRRALRRASEKGPVASTAPRGVRPGPRRPRTGKRARTAAAPRVPRPRRSSSRASSPPRPARTTRRRARTTRARGPSPRPRRPRARAASSSSPERRLLARSLSRTTTREAPNGARASRREAWWKCSAHASRACFAQSRRLGRDHQVQELGVVAVERVESSGVSGAESVGVVGVAVLAVDARGSACCPWRGGGGVGTRRIATGSGGVEGAGEARRPRGAM